MKLDSDYLLILIEHTRRNLNDLARSKSLTDPSIVEMSQRLDRLLNEYYLITKSMKIAS